MTSVRRGSRPEDALGLMNVLIQSNENIKTTRPEMCKEKLVRDGAAINLADFATSILLLLPHINKY